MPSNLSKARLTKAFNEGRRSAGVEVAVNPYDNATLKRLWEQGRAKQQAGEITTPIPALEHGERRAQRTSQNPPGSRRPPARPSARPSSNRPWRGPAPRRRDR